MTRGFSFDALVCSVRQSKHAEEETDEVVEKSLDPIPLVSNVNPHLHSNEMHHDTTRASQASMRADEG